MGDCSELVARGLLVDACPKYLGMKDGGANPTLAESGVPIFEEVGECNPVLSSSGNEDMRPGEVTEAGVSRIAFHDIPPLDVLLKSAVLEHLLTPLMALNVLGKYGSKSSVATLEVLAT